ncbi:MAG: hypothetical protein WBA22_15620 [Candidatus Methanofastidiosia archaeon]
MVSLKLVALFVLCVLSLQMLSFGGAEITAGPAPQLPLLLRPNLRLDPGSVILVGREADPQDVVASAFVRLGLQSWINDSTTRITFKRPDLKLNFLGVNPLALNSLGICTVNVENAQGSEEGILLVSVGGPDVNMTTRKLNLELPLKLLKDHQNDTWTITSFVEGEPTQYVGDEYGIIAFLPNQPCLNGETLEDVLNGNRQLGTLVVAGNGREGTLAASIYLRGILNGTNLKGRWISRELDKVLIWMVSGEKQDLHPVVVIVKYTGEDTAEFVDIFFF